MSKDTVIHLNEYNKFNNGRTTYTFTNFAGINVFTNNNTNDNKHGEFENGSMRERESIGKFT